MLTRQATRLLAAILLLTGLFACSPAEELPLPTFTPPPSPTFTPSPLPLVPTLTATAFDCRQQPGQLKTGSVPTNGKSTNYIIYLPPCYDFLPEERYPVLYLLNGLPMDNDPASAGTQWIRIGAPEAADLLNRTGKYQPFIIVFPEDRYWNVVQGTLFGQFLVSDIVPYIDSNFRTIADYPHRAVGGLSRGGGWALQITLIHPGVFWSVGLHSAAIFPDDRANLEYWVRERSPELWPRLYIDSGDNDLERGYNTTMEGLFTQYGIPHEWHLNTGDHSEAYWSEHVLEYLMWYAQGFEMAGAPLPTFPPTLTAEPSATSTPEPLPSSTGGPAATKTGTPSP